MKTAIKQTLAAAGTFLTLASINSSLVFAQAGGTLNPCDTTTTGTQNSGQFIKSLCGIGATNVGSVIRSVIVLLFVVAVVIALFFLIWGGIKWILSGGDKGKVEAARSTIIAALIGLVITFLAYFILSIILGIFGLTFSNIELPKIVTGP